MFTLEDICDPPLSHIVIIFSLSSHTILYVTCPGQWCYLTQVVLLILCCLIGIYCLFQIPRMGFGDPVCFGCYFDVGSIYVPPNIFPYDC